LNVKEDDDLDLPSNCQVEDFASGQVEAKAVKAQTALKAKNKMLVHAKSFVKRRENAKSSAREDVVKSAAKREVESVVGTSIRKTVTAAR
jgi:hypothetical protein